MRGCSQSETRYSHKLIDGIATTATHRWDAAAYQAFLTDIGYLCPQPEPFQISTEGVDPEIAQIAGPQLVVPVMNARFALNAANARWGSLYDALYGTDAIAETDGAERGGAYNAVRGERVIAWARRFLDTHFPVGQGSHQQATAYVIIDGALVIEQIDGSQGQLVDPGAMGGLHRQSRHAR
jgi:malate synthase